MLIDFSRPEALEDLLDLSVRKNKPIILCTTGYTDEQLNLIKEKSKIIPIFKSANMSLGINLLSSLLRKIVPSLYENYDIEIIEKHHNQKLDAPSGTAVTTLAKIAQNRAPMKQGMEDEYEKIEGARGGEYEGMRVHSVRLPGYVASQEVIFGGLGQTLPIRHDSISRESFMPGIMLAAKKVQGWKGLLEDLENIME